MLRCLRSGKARARAVKLCKEFVRDECEMYRTPRVSRVSALRRATHFNQIVGIDLFETGLCDGARVTGVNIAPNRKCDNNNSVRMGGRVVSGSLEDAR